MNKDDQVFESLIAGGLIGAALGALLSSKKDGPVIGAIAGAAIMATFNASEQAKDMNVPLHAVENGKLYEIMSDGTKRYIRDIPKRHGRLKRQYKLK